jgi:hypothetical protein
MVSPAVNPSACWEFEGEILVLHHPTTISSRYQAMGKLSCSWIAFLRVRLGFLKILSGFCLTQSVLQSSGLYGHF